MQVHPNYLKDLISSHVLVISDPKHMVVPHLLLIILFFSVLLPLVLKWLLVVNEWINSSAPACYMKAIFPAGHRWQEVILLIC